jgi:hypothetical protein
MAEPTLWPNRRCGADIFFPNDSGNADVFEANSRQMFANNEIFNIEACFMIPSGMPSIVAFLSGNRT